MPKIIHSASTSSPPPQRQVKRLSWEKLEEEPQKMLDDATCAKRQGEVVVMSGMGISQMLAVVWQELAAVGLHVFHCFFKTVMTCSSLSWK